MLNNTYRFAELNIEIRSIYAYIHELCTDYVTDQPADFMVNTTQDDILFERERSEDLRASDEYLETLAVYRKIAEKIPEYDAFLFHGSSIKVDGCAYIFTAKSGTGKSTHAALWRKLLSDKAVMINDDKPIIRVTSSGTAYVYGTPWDGKHKLSANTYAPVQAICILDRSDSNSIKRISKTEALPVLLQQVYRPFESSAMERTMDLLFKMDAEFYHLFCNMDISAAELSYGVMRKGNNET